MTSVLLSVLAHHSEPGDPVLLAWIRHQIDAIFGLGPAAIVIALGLVIVIIPVVVVVALLAWRARQKRQ